MNLLWCSTVLLVQLFLPLHKSTPLVKFCSAVHIKDPRQKSAPTQTHGLTFSCGSPAYRVLVYIAVALLRLSGCSQSVQWNWHYRHLVTNSSGVVGVALVGFSPYGSHEVFSPFAFGSLYKVQRNTVRYRWVKREVLVKCSKLLVKKPCFLKKPMKLLIKRNLKLNISLHPTSQHERHLNTDTCTWHHCIKNKGESAECFFSELLGNINTTVSIIPQGTSNSTDNFVLYRQTWSENWECCYSPSTKQLLSNCAAARFKLHNQMKLCFVYDSTMTKTSNSLLVF